MGEIKIHSFFGLSWSRHRYQNQRFSNRNVCFRCEASEWDVAAKKKPCSCGEIWLPRSLWIKTKDSLDLLYYENSDKRTKINGSSVKSSSTNKNFSVETWNEEIKPVVTVKEIVWKSKWILDNSAFWSIRTIRTLKQEKNNQSL